MSFSIANTALNAHTEQLNTISNNIANSATKGFKASRTEFSSMYAQSQPLGVAVSGVSQNISKDGQKDKTGMGLDLAISGGGFFVVRESSGDKAYTRAGMFRSDVDGYLVNGQGMKLQGYPADAAGNIQAGIISDLKINNAGVPAKASTNLDFMANLEAGATVPVGTFNVTDQNSYNFTTTSTVYDSLGREHAVAHYFIKSTATTSAAPNQWTVHHSVDGTVAGASHTLQFTNTGVLIPSSSAKLTGAFNPAGAAAYDIDIDYTGTTQLSQGFTTTRNKSDGYTSGVKNGERIESDGSVYATFSNGERMLQGKVVLANFASPSGLVTQNGTSWSESNKSGAALLGTPGTGLLGSLESGALENSNVDITAELVGLMTAQRNYQASTKIISTNDSMMNALFQVL
ncbi:flagellar hook protein FlgE [Yersinia pseudotuberculosis]|uniref:Flagellar hook protein FlgE n=1 Tax=Yersinia pseudotuberculosis TaxID=633 RepID=A0ABN5R4Q2_YERPU|nr:flagellar hook protein FlgE [Yersinia pseudotuberculosis]AIN13279.1 flagellar hook-basal body family protein [Yersinia pseudotuberculosis]AYW91916.1 flagellar basal body protein FlaE [Yersinia pseudotuberculosis]KGA58614.1 flagellar hook-basal body family protein [Yersinia pseudotuberculosis]MBO1632173.1 flagellar basal body protein FlgE [Yersinia pseudotuberculosis]MBP0071795.1 flagellar basal body protein FlaE [Yersinia pseudotuberculosis]